MDNVNAQRKPCKPYPGTQGVIWIKTPGTAAYCLRDVRQTTCESSL